MIDNFREFDAGPDPFGVTWHVSFGWQQTAISIRHSDSVDVKFFLYDGETQMEKVIALVHTDLLRLSQEEGRPLADAWCMKLAALHMKHVVESGEDFDKTIITPSYQRLQQYAAMLRGETPAVGVPQGQHY
jgi:hypothetical protein